MIKQIHSIARVARLLPFGMVLLLGMQTAQAKQCSAAMPPNPQGIGLTGSSMGGNAGTKAKTTFRNHYCSGLSRLQPYRLPVRRSRPSTRN